MADSLFNRDYESLLGRINAFGTREERMVRLVDLLWNELHGVSWIGFYLDQPGEPDERRLILGPCRDTPACSPIGMHGACGRALFERRPLIVRDIEELGPNYIACDPRDRSEIVLPLIDPQGRCYGVLDADSREVGAFDEKDAQGLVRVLLAAGLTIPSACDKRPGINRGA